jgi:Trimethylamine:corrinoid methyltransferase
VHDATMQVLEEIGIEFLNEEAKKVLSDAGCKVDMNSRQCQDG